MPIDAMLPIQGLTLETGVKAAQILQEVGTALGTRSRWKSIEEKFEILDAKIQALRILKKP
jgi:hypothetical protein